MLKGDIKWAPIIPLIGGFPLGAEKQLGKPPEFVASYEGFWKNDSQYMNYQNNTLGRSIDYVNLTEEGNRVPDPSREIDIAVCTPPCAALSQLNTGKTPESKGSGCAKNEWMYQCAKDAIDIFKAKVVITENAPALYTTKGKGVLDNLTAIAEERGYSISFYKTSTHFHGLPQRRDRAFMFMWKSEYAPLLSWFTKEFTHFNNYIDEIPEDALQNDIIINPKVATEPYFRFIQDKLKLNVRETLISEGVITTLGWINKHNLIQEANDWFHEVGDELGIKYSDHAIKKYKQGLGVWDGSVHIFNDKMNAVIGRNLADTIHPVHNRSLTIREAMYMMGFPLDFELVGGKKNTNLIAQNVPVSTACDMVGEAVKFLQGELRSSGSTFVKQSNWQQRVDETREAKNDLGEFFN